MQIGKYIIKGKAVLAPMAGVTDLPFRQLCSELGAAMVTGEMTSSNPALRNTLKSKLRTAQPNSPIKPREPRAVQIAGTEPEEMAAAAEYQVNLGAQIIDINMGCPAKKVCKKAAGSALLKDEQLVQQILTAVIQRVDVPVTLKIRTGWDEQHKNALTIAKIAEQAGIAALTIHGRTRAAKFKGQAEYDTVAKVVDSVAIPVIANGDIDNAQKAQKILASTGAAAVMIGRAAQGKPWLFNEINALLGDSQVNCGLFNGKSLNFNDAIALERLIIKHLQMIDQYYACVNNDRLVQNNGRESVQPCVPLGVKVARKHVCWYFDQLKHIITKRYKKESRTHFETESDLVLAKKATIFAAINEARTTFNRLESQHAQLELIHSFFRDLPTTGDIAA